VSHYDITKFKPVARKRENNIGDIDSETRAVFINIDANADIYFRDSYNGPVIAKTTARRLISFLVGKGVADRVIDEEVCR
jgi:hypothetical protein